MHGTLILWVEIIEGRHGGTPSSPLWLQHSDSNHQVFTCKSDHKLTNQLPGKIQWLCLGTAVWTTRKQRDWIWETKNHPPVFKSVELCPHTFYLAFLTSLFCSQGGKQPQLTFTPVVFRGVCSCHRPHALLQKDATARDYFNRERANYSSV